MQKLKKLLTIGLAFLFILCTGMSFISCQDLTPKTLGKPEGLYLYKRNYRSLTDGSQREFILSEITVDGITYFYEEDEFYIRDLNYRVEQKEILYQLYREVFDDEKKVKYINYFWYYNYDTKENGLLYTFESSGIPYLFVSDSYIFIKTNTSTDEPKLFDREFHLVYEGAELCGYTLYNDILYKYDRGTEFSWWRNGEFVSIILPAETYISQNTFYVANGYIYVSIPDRLIYGINLNTKEGAYISMPSGNKIVSKEYDKNSNVFYIITSTNKTFYETQSGDIELNTGCKLWKINGTNAEHIYTFKEEYEVNCIDHIVESYLNIYGRRIENGKDVYFSAHYDLANDQYGEYYKTLKRGYNLVVGEYTFYITWAYTTGYWVGNYYYYLHRVHNNKDEIINYAVVDEMDVDYPLQTNAIYDDIHVR